MWGGSSLFEYQSRSKFRDWAPDVVSECAWFVVDAWKAGTPSRADRAAVKAFIAEELAGWGAGLVWRQR